MEGNKIIAEFMQKGSIGLGLYDFDGCHYKLDELEFHTSSNWLNPVLDKVWSMEGGARSVCVDWSDSHEEVYDSILDFIKDLNK